jgi:hypothetical protein
MIFEIFSVISLQQKKVRFAATPNFMLILQRDFPILAG